jgi:beta-phosphoglucomutase family hydrolase
MPEHSSLPGVIFDIDGVLMNSNPAHYESWRVMGEEYGFDFTPQLFQETFGQRSDAIIAACWPGPLTSEEILRMAERKEAIYREMIEENFPAMPGAAEFVRSLAQRGFVLSVGSSGPELNVSFVLQRLGIRPLLRGVVSGTDVSHAKPAPDIFLACAEKMQLAAIRCVVIEDSASGVQAAKAAGMKVVGFFSVGHKPEEYEGVDLLVRSFEELSSERLLSLF